MDKKVKVGDPVIWKADLEEYGVVKEIKGDYAVVTCWDSEEGTEYFVEVPLYKLTKEEM